VYAQLQADAGKIPNNIINAVMKNISALSYLATYMILAKQL